MCAASLTQHAEAKMWDLYNHHDNEVGSQYPGDRTGKTVTDCITNCIVVISYAYEQVGQPDVARRVRLQSDGMKMGNFLRDQGWKAHYWNPDVREPRDRLPEHPASFQTARDTGKYQALDKNRHIVTLPVEGFIVNYRKTSPSASNPNNIGIFNTFSAVRFSFAMARGGTHTFLISCGMVFEVHWDQIGAGLYEKSPFYTYAWNSGALLVPPDESFVSEPAPPPPAAPSLFDRVMRKIFD